MTDEDALIRALAARPEDEVTRLAYRDWLDERGDPRADYLRSEVAWARDSGSDRTAQQAMAALSHRAGSIDPAWLSQVSLVGAAVARAWAAVTLLPGVGRNESPPSDPVETFSAALVALNEVVARRFGTEFASRHFRVPIDYMSFLCKDGGAWSWDEWGDIRSARGLAPTLDDELEAGAVQADSIRAEGLWLHIADWHDRDGYYLCVDPEHALFNVVAVEGPEGLWENGVEGLGFVAPTFLHFLRDALPKIVQGLWSYPLTIGDWLRSTNPESC